MKELYSKIILLLLDLLAIFISIVIGYEIRYFLGASFEHQFGHTLSLYLSLWMIYVFPIGLMFNEGIYTRRYDFWHESRLVLKALFMSLILILAILAMTKTINEYSRATIIFIFLSISFFIPLFKNIGKKYLYKIGLWQRKVKIYSHDTFLSEEIKTNHYLGYIEVHKEEPKTVFINSTELGIDATQAILHKEVKKHHEVIFIPLINEYNLTHSFIYELSNTRTNLIVFQNRLKSPLRTEFKNISDFMLSLLMFPFLIPVMLAVAYKIKRENPDEKIFFKQKRLGKHGKPFNCYKFQTMYENSDAMLETYLKEHPEEIDYYQKYHKYEHDPRVTKVGHFLRRTSLDELPQIFNVFRGDMSFIGPRPYMLDEKEIIGEEIETILSVKPGITGLWQVSGRSDVDFQTRVELDVWYIRNWNLWMDLVILIKTIKTVLVREGAS
ncbi:glycosyl transferase [Sulfurovum lithotrophicum]|uniref:Glycosyl transferase n=1 Tax=Sulfurovum lithotrophicum TaxID=206403 RepID=A0A7U4M002_9BACT|nr:sugar transferase [Sulfurovum lithotrophicum]AKF24353.1 glycosyl transferase [Sulfurovum lithotrophicum]